MPIDFPNSPTAGDSYSAAGKTWTYDGTTWVLYSVTAEVPNGSITTGKIASGAVTADKLAPGVGGGGLDTDSDGAIITMDIGA